MKSIKIVINLHIFVQLQFYIGQFNSLTIEFHQLLFKNWTSLLTELFHLLNSIEIHLRHVELFQILVRDQIIVFGAMKANDLGVKSVNVVFELADLFQLVENGVNEVLQFHNDLKDLFSPLLLRWFEVIEFLLEEINRLLQMLGLFLQLAILTINGET